MIQEGRLSRRAATWPVTFRVAAPRPGLLLLALLAAALLGCSHHITHVYIEESPGQDGLPPGAEQIALEIIQQVAHDYEFIFVPVSQSTSDLIAYYTKGSMDLRLFKDEVSESLVFVLKDFDTWDATPIAQRITREITQLASERLPETTVVMSSQHENFPYGP